MFSFPLRCCGHVKHWNYSVLASTHNFGHILSGLGCQRKFYSKDKDCCKEVVQSKGKVVDVWPKTDPPPPAWRCECPTEPQPVNYDPYRIKVPDVAVPPLPMGSAQPMIDSAPAKKRGPCSALPAPPPPPCVPPPPVPFPWIYVGLFATFLTFTGLLYKYLLYKEEQAKLGESIPIWRPRARTRKPFYEKDVPACVQYLIVGAGAAGWAAYQAIKEHDKFAKVFFISKEDCLPYEQPPMSKQMWWNIEPPDLSNLPYLIDGKQFSMYVAACKDFLDPVKFYRKPTGPALSIAIGWPVVRVDADEHAVYVNTLCGEQPVYYERCLLATGSKAKNLSIFTSAPPKVREKVCKLRTIRDLEIAYRKVKEAKHVTIIGGGILGTELAWTLAQMERMLEAEGNPRKSPEILQVIKDKGLMSGILPEYLGEWAVEKIREQGVTVMPKTQIYDAYSTKDDRLELTTSNGSSIITDYVFVAIGAEPRTELAESSFLETDSINGGFEVNTELKARTHLYVAGDAASFYSQWKGHRIRTEHYMNAVEEGHIAGANMTGYWTPCNVEPHFWLRLGETLQMEVVGEVGACMPTVALFKQCAAECEPAKPPPAPSGDGDKPCYKKTSEYQSRYKRGILFYLRDEIIVGFVFWNIPPVDDRTDVATEILRARPSYKDIEMIAELLGFHETQCVYIPDEAKKKPPVCFENVRVY